ncbi:hypothetical protein LJC46_04370 [Desulfovibrio sp. OttesenSCG-928-G15]|nr:hypothetical protein [Desulfovibrio sp. OttesenSCG-928-G15]
MPIWAGWGGGFKSAYLSERGSFIMDLAREKDANGQPLSDEVLRAASDTYAFLAATVETAGEAVFLKLLKPLGLGNVGKGGIRGFVRSAVRKAALDRSTGWAMLDTVSRLGLNALSEGVEESAQEALSIFTEFAAKGYENHVNDKNFVGNNLFTAENAERIKESFGAGSVAGFWLGSGPIMASGAMDIRSARAANEYAKQHLELHEFVEETSTKQLSPAHMQSALEAAGPAMLEKVELPADAALELYQSGTDVLSPLGITEQEAVAAAEHGQSFTVQASRMHAYLDQQQFDAAAQIMRRGADGMSVVEAARLDEELAANAATMLELYQGQAEEFAAFDAAVADLRTQTIASVNAVPGLKAQAESLAGGVESYVDTWLKPMQQFAQRMVVTGRSPLEVFKKISVQSLLRSRIRPDQLDFSNMTEEEQIAAYEQMEEREAKREAKRESLLNRVRGRIDGKSLQRDYPDAYREITRLHGPIFKSRENGGVPLDYLAAELVSENVLEQGMGADELLEMLKMPKRRYFQPVNLDVNPDQKISVVPLDGATPLGFTGSEAKKFVSRWKGIPLEIGTDATGKVKAEISRKDPRHPFWSSHESGRKNKDRLAALSELERVLAGAVRIEDTDAKHQGVNKTIRFYAPVSRGGEIALLRIITHEMKGKTAEIDGVEVYDIIRERPYSSSGRTTERGVTGHPSKITIRQMLSGVKDSEGKVYFQSAYHGSPHRFDDFSLEHIGSGEGAQAYGWGLYFAGKKEIAEWYREKLAVDEDAYWANGDMYRVYMSGGVEKTFEWSDGYNTEILSSSDPASYALDAIVKEKTKEDAKRRVRDEMEDYGESEDDILRAIELVEEFEKATPGQLYEVDIPEDSEMLDLDAPLSEQSEGVIDALLSIEQHLPQNTLEDLGGDISLLLDMDQTGADFYGTLSSLIGGPEESSRLLNSIGVKGNRYLDGISRDKGEGTHNYVVFDDSAIDILNTYYQSGKSKARGSVSIHSEGYLVNLFRKADLSTLLHETGHIFYEEMEFAVRSGVADKTMSDDFETLGKWVGALPGAALSEEQREQIARGFEAYLMEGKAPSEELAGAFARFKKWLTTIYKSAKRLKVDLNDDVRGVFDRMLSLEQEMAKTAARFELLDLTESQLDALGVTGPAREWARKLMTAARETASQRLEEDRNRDRKRRLGQYAKEARKDLLEQPVYAARSDMRKTPLDAATVRELYGEDTAGALRKSLPFGLQEEGGVDPEIFAAEHGFDSGSDMVAQIVNSPSLKKAVEQRVNQKESEHDAAFPPADYLVETAQANEQVAMVGKYLAQNLGRQHVQQEAFARVVEQELAGMPMGKAVQTGNFLAAMRRALRQERLAIGRGDFSAALEANHKARLNMEFASRSREIARAQGVMQRLVKRFIGMSKADPDARYIVMDTGMRHGLNTYHERLGEGRDVRTVQGWLKEAEANGYTIYADDAILYGQGKPWREMTLTDFESLSEVINQIVTVERNMRQVDTLQGKADLKAVADGIASSIYKHRNPKTVKTVEGEHGAVKALKGVHAIHMKVESMCIALDGDTRGPTWEAIYLPIANAEDAQSLRFKEVRDALVSTDLFGRYTRKELANMGSRKKLVREVGESLTWENSVALALNMGNETNISRIKDGHGWNDDQISAVLRTLSRRDWGFVQSVWDYIGSFKEEAFSLQEQISGMRPASVEARPFTVQTADGHTIQMRGGYYPIKYNSEKGFRAFMQEQKAMDKELFGGRNYGAAMTKNGHLKERANGGMGSPLLLELSVITDHVFNVVHDITYRKAVLDVSKVIKHKKVREAIESTVGQEMYREIMPWLQDVANERQEPMHAVHRWARWARAGSSIMTMGYKMTTMLAQPLGFTQSAEVLGYKWAGSGLKRVYGNPLKMPQLLEETFALSPFMANRIKSFDREVRDMAKQLKPGMGRFAWVDKVKDNAFVPMGVFQMGVDLPTWWGAFEKGMHDLNGDEKRAALYADSVVRMSQGSGSTKDLARVQRGGDLLRLTTMFYSYFNTLYNLGARGITALKEDHSPAGIFKAANTALLLWFVPAVISELFAGRGPDDDEAPAEWAAMNILQYPFQSVVGVRDVTNAIFGEYGYQLTPAESAPKAIVNWFKAVNKALEAEDAGKMIKPTAEAAGYLFGLPMKQPIITVGNMWDYITGEDPEFYARDLFFVKPKSRRK